MTDHIVVLGAGYAGLGAAKRAARRLRSTGVRVTLVNAADRFVERVRLHQLAAGQRLPDLPLAGLLDGTGVGLVLAQVTGLDLQARTVQLDGPPYTLSYDVLVYALGSAAELDTVPGVREHAWPIATEDDAVRLRARLAGPGPGPVTVVGGGLTGIETAAELAETRPGLRVELLCAGPVAPGLSVRGRRHVHRAFARLGVVVREHEPVAKVGPDGVLLESGDEVPARTVVWAGGFRVSPLAAASGLRTDEEGRMVVDRSLRSVSHPEVFGIGDAAAPPGERSSMSCQTGLPMGLCTGDAVADLVTGRKPGPARFRHVWRNLSLGRRDGVTQFTRADDSPLDVVLTGRASAAFKESIIRGTVQVMRHPGPYRPLA
ncbi:FAD-dependent oxidoreductase [Nonomuraea sp. B1E8]|uniref:NAD(P)/FAD-dependent oxidoreductase n=1 Tax=unclassified Nonomuraea TaxID=2593643 RepID=UPI00325DDFAB